MTRQPSPLHRIFSFGTLLDAQVQRHLFGAQVPTQRAELPGHGLTEVRIEDPEVIAASGLDVHRGLARVEGRAVSGGLLELDDAQLAACDAYEVSAYARRRVLLGDGSQAWAYVDASALQAAERVGILGDSIAYGRCDPSGGWARLLGGAHIAKNEERNRVFNLAVPGMTASELAGGSREETASRRCDTVFIACGVNDLLHGASPGRAAAAVKSIAESVEASGARPVVLGALWLDAERSAREFGAACAPEDIAALNALLAEWGAETSRDVIDPSPVLAGRTELLADGLHPTAEGHRRLASFLLDTL